MTLTTFSSFKTTQSLNRLARTTKRGSKLGQAMLWHTLQLTTTQWVTMWHFSFEFSRWLMSCSVFKEAQATWTTASGTTNARRPVDRISISGAGLSRTTFRKRKTFYDYLIRRLTVIPPRHCNYKTYQFPKISSYILHHGCWWLPSWPLKITICWMDSSSIHITRVNVLIPAFWES